MSERPVPEAICLGEILIDFIARPKGRGLAGAEAFEPKPGGAPANVAVALARLGRKSAFVGMVGRDAFGDLLRETLRREGVDIRSLAASRTQPTTLAFVALDENAVPDFSFYRHPGADQSLEPADVDASLFAGAKLFHFGSLSLTGAPASLATLRALELAKRRGLAVSYDPNYRPALWPGEDEARRRMLAPLAEVDLLKVSEEELRLLSGETDMARGCEALAARGPSLVAVTRGAGGAAGWTGGRLVEIPGERVEAIDTTGCGDSFMAGLLARLLEGGVLEARGVPRAISAEAFAGALAFANRCAARTSQAVGAIPAFPRGGDLPASP